MTKKIIEGSVVISIQGYDVNKLYVVKQVVDGYAFLIDGKQRHYKNPKKKNLKHVKAFSLVYNLQNKSINQINDEIIKLIKLFKKALNNL